MKIASIVGARPQFVKLAPLVQGIEEHNRARGAEKIEHVIIHTGQHYDYRMNKVFFDELGIPEPRYNLNVGSATHGRQTGEMLIRIEGVLLREQPAWTLVYGDTNSTLAGAIAAVKLGRPLAHVEAGLRSYRRDMPEEINRVLTDHCADLLFCPTKTAVRNLRKEGFTNVSNSGNLISRLSLRRSTESASFPLVVNVGDIMVDALLLAGTIAEKKSRILEKMGLKPKSYYLATLHRAENTDQPEILQSLMTTFAEIHAKEKPLVFCLHPRTRKALKKCRLFSKVARSMILIDPPPSYFDILILEKSAAKILTDSGGIQKEAFFFSVPCITLRNETEWVETTRLRRNIIAGTNRRCILEAVRKKPAGTATSSEMPYGKGTARTLILDALTTISPTQI
jgi:UDP-N-acetylglucosamine 2-epimerase